MVKEGKYSKQHFKHLKSLLMPANLNIIRRRKSKRSQWDVGSLVWNNMEHLSKEDCFGP